MLRAALIFALGAAIPLVSGCGVGCGISFFGSASCGGGEPIDPNWGDSGADDANNPTLISEAAPPCTNPSCMCDPSSPTTISGTVYAPNSTLPLYGAYVFVPSVPPDPMPAGLACTGCGLYSGKPIAATISDTKGRFRLQNVPTGANIPVVIQIGKWRRTFKLDVLASCADNPVPNGMARLPRNRDEGDMPRFAVTTSACDGLACLLSQVGVDPAEIGVDSNGPTRVVVYQGAGSAAPASAKSASALWNDAKELSRFDFALLSCECAAHDENKTTPDALREFTEMGGRVLATHEQVTWPRDLVPQWSNVASWSAVASASPFTVDVSFPRGKALADWLSANGGSTTYAELAVGAPFFDVGASAPPTTRWLYGPGATLMSTFRAPTGKPPAQQCGAFSTIDLHVSRTSVVDATFPAACAPVLDPEALALAFLLFDQPPSCPQHIGGCGEVPCPP